MPWHVSSDHPDCKGFAVVKDDDGEVEGCHTTREAANRQMAALYANERASKPLLPRGFPVEVAERLSDRRGEVFTRQQNHLVEHRLAKVELRDVSNDVGQIHGYATVYDYPYEVAGLFTETIGSGATRKSIQERDDVRLLINHDGIPLARTKSGTLQLASDEVGLLMDAQLDIKRSTQARDVISAMERGDLDEMSFAFEVMQGTWSADRTERSITEVKLYDVSLVTYPANPAASAYIRKEDAEQQRGMSLSRALAEAQALSLRN